MQANHVLALMNREIITIVVTFDLDRNTQVGKKPKEYTYLALRTDNIEVGDTVLVHNSEEYKTCTVQEVHNEVLIEATPIRRYKFIVQKINIQRYWDIVRTQENAEQKFQRIEATSKAKKIMEAYRESMGEAANTLEQLAAEITQPAIEFKIHEKS
jgi:hypothetical protein